jgi:hypothetical protein
VTGALDAGVIDGVGGALVAVTAIAYLLAALATAGILVPAGWWRPLVVVASIASATVLAFSPTGWTVPGLLIDAALLVAVLGPSWRPAPFFGRQGLPAQTPSAATCVVPAIPQSRGGGPAADGR